MTTASPSSGESPGIDRGKITTRSCNCKPRRRPASTLRRKVQPRQYKHTVQVVTVQVRHQRQPRRAFPRANIMAGSQSLSRNRITRPGMVVLIKALLRYHL